jgi:hypothetical protein
MPLNFASMAWRDLPTSSEVEERIAEILSPKKVRPVVTRGGHRARGRFPSARFSQTRYESLVEEDALRIMEVASCVLSCRSHPYVLDLIDPETGRHFQYTPDVALRPDHTMFVLEVKGDWLLRLPKPRASLLRICRSLKCCGVPFAVLAERDIRANGLQERLKLLLRRRPTGARRMSEIDKTVWDPLNSTTPSAQDLRLWREAQEECNALLRRVMGRDPEDFVECFGE